ncbi:hypothetical protein CAPTEDRAFT_200907 [Capitella teleta]|uniref:THO complex subunit 2 N-terminal domain-containing protein n=1 Tax=Capitella teleta TaxID=283909 RepID=R7U5S6_CAPTE|nr:hypothetical protein CAPTEDRAFT_200907 [Capitella teleta]|eukprot:ELU01725.1 hypothetical protein CAPTEDRAFT_200907 [Capitella teleta]
MSESVASEISKSWEKSGKSDFIQQCRSIVENETHLVGGIDRKDAKRALYDVCWLALKGSLKVEQTVGALTEVMELHDELSSVLADVLGVLVEKRKEIEENPRIAV